jgi:hypothetical protein
MKDIYWCISLFFAGIFFLYSIAYADQINGLSEIYDTPIPAEIRRNFDEYIQIRKDSADYRQSIFDGEKFMDIYAKKFLVIGLEANSFGGIWAVITVKAEENRVFRLWLYNVEQNVYDLRIISQLTGSFYEEFVENMSGSQYSDFWL